MIFNLKYK